MCMICPVENEFDIVGAFDVLEYVSDGTAPAARQLARVKWAVALLSASIHQWPRSPLDDYSRHQRPYARGRHSSPF